MSFFDEADEPRTAPRTVPRSRRPSGSGRRPPGGQQTIQMRRGVAAVAALIVLILVILGVHSCQVSARNSSLKDYNNTVASLIQQSDQTGAQFFNQLSSGSGAANPQNLQAELENTRVSAQNELSRAQSISVPDEMRAAHTNLLLTLQLRRDGIANIAAEIQPALGTSTSKDAINQIAAEMARFYASDVTYKDYTIPLIIAALHSAGIGVGGTNGETIQNGQFFPDLGWLTPAFVATKLGAKLPAATGKPAPGLHGHALSSVSVGGTTLQTGSTNTLPANPAPTFTLHFTNGGANTETNVVLKVTVSGTSVSGQTVVPQTTPGQQVTGQVTLSSAPTPGNATVTATVEPVPGEKNTANNALSFPVTFQ